MDLLIPDSWLRDYLKTKATPKQIGKCLSLCGPSVEKVEKKEKDSVYSIEVTTNRVDTASVYGIAREASAILPHFKITATLETLKSSFTNNKLDKSLPLFIKSIPEVRRIMAVVIDNVDVKESPDWLKKRLELSGLRSLNLLIDITNYVMLETGHPTHVFDYDKIESHQLIFRISNKGEKLQTLDNKIYTLIGEDIIIGDGQRTIIDLPGIIGTANSVVTPETRRIVFFIDNNDPTHIRRTSISLGIRTAAAAINEKGVDPELASLAFAKGVELYTTLANGKIASDMIDIYPKPYLEKSLDVNLRFISERLGISLRKNQITESLEPLGFKVSWQEENLTITVPSWRANDVDIPEDIVEEIARIYGYHNLPSNLMTGVIPDPLANSPFAFEKKIKDALAGWGGTEVYTYSMVAKDKVDLTGSASWVLKLKNPLGAESEYMRLSLAPSLVDAVNENKGETTPYHLFELANVYLPVRGDLPEEKMTAAGVFVNYKFEDAKGVLETLLETLKSDVVFAAEDGKGFAKHQRLAIKSGREEIGQFGVLQNSGLIYWEIDVEALRQVSVTTHSYKPFLKYPAQVEDLSLLIPARTLLGQVIETISKEDSQIVSVELVDSFVDTRTFRIAYQNPDKTLTDREVEAVRSKMLKSLEKKFRVKLKS